MNLSGLLPDLQSALEEHGLAARLDDGTPLLLGLPDGAKAALVATLASTGRPVLVVSPRPDRAAALAEEVASWLGDPERVHLFPEREALPYERLAPDPLTLRDRLRTLYALSEDRGPLVVVASGQAVAQRTLTPEELLAGPPGGRAGSERLTVGGRLAPEAFLRRLVQRGYRLTSLVDMPGQASRRGGIIDVFPPVQELPLRIELLGDQVESIRSFRPDTQRSTGRLEEATVGPAREMLLPSPPPKADPPLADEAGAFLSRLDLSTCPPGRTARGRFERETELLAAGEGFDDDYFYTPFLARGTLLDFLPSDALLVWDEPADLASVLEERDGEVLAVREEMVGRGELPAGLPLPHLPWPELRAALESRQRRIDLSRWASGESAPGGRLPFAAAPAYGGRLRVLAGELSAAVGRRERVVLVSQQAARLSEVLAEQGLATAVASAIEEPLPAGALALVQGSLPQGWVLRGTRNLRQRRIRLRRKEPGTGNRDLPAAPLFPLTLLTDSEVFGFAKQRRLAPRRFAHREAFLAELSPGDYVVHIEHGIARFAGLTHKTLDGNEREYLELRYAQGDRLFVPTDQVDRVTRYVGPGDFTPALTRLGSGDWVRTKERVRRAVGDLARELLGLYAARQVLQGHAFPPDTAWQQELEASFPYLETPDQLEAVRQVKSDMETARPMDRLVCGDVGYGKTEVAIRAAFKAVLDGRQAAMLVPTTVLAQQHHRTFQERLSSFPVRIEMLSRFRSERDQRQVVSDLASGAVDIVIGTHRLLQKDVAFKNLGLVIIDEEQRFGVAHKERLKQMRREVDVLTLSATPIPRTLHMSLVGIRDMSTMETPPEERLPIKTYVSEFDDRLVREAIIRELERGGQVYLVHNRIYNIEQIAHRLRDLVPEAETAVAHGRMPEEQLERVMLDFVRGGIDVLVCTTIIESGLDIPNVNTIIINQANRLGLAQLYQLRGRVGRGAFRAYAYLLYDRGRVLTEPAQKRLQTIFEATELGAGFQIALKDLEIRGAGNLLGAEQSGHIGAVGFELYVRLLAEAVERLKALQRGEKPPLAATARPALTLDLPLTAHIPHSYVPDLNLRLALYQRLASAEEESEVEEVAREMADRFGPLPPPVHNLLFAVQLRLLAQRAGVQSIQTEDGQIVVRLAGGAHLPREELRRRAPPEVWVGQTQVRLDRDRLGESWREVLAGTLLTVAAATAPTGA
jgi:transcription-repair coupling factor (superfamily II helicase)